ncbi:MAG: HDIG domain-containing protein [Myxococcota bacterium]|jgi:hypothetical protein|nr:HDIG domain-containing protein [Myxococcota bacterium]
MIFNDNNGDGFEAWTGALARFWHSRPCQLLICFLPVIVAGFLLAPVAGSRQFKSDESLLATPAVENIKAPYDLKIQDDAATEKYQRETLSKVKRVYDFDYSRGQKVALKVREAFKAMGVLAQPVNNALPDDTPAGPDVGRLESLLGTALTAKEFNALKEGEFRPALAHALARVIEQVMSEPLVGSGNLLAADEGRGIHLQKVPSSEGPGIVIEDINTILDLEFVRRDMPVRVQAYQTALGQEERQVVAALAGRLVEPNVTFNRAASEVAREVARLSVRPVLVTVQKGEMIIRDGERYTTRHLLILQEMGKSHHESSLFLTIVGSMLVVFFLVCIGWMMARGHRWMIYFTSRDLFFLVTMFSLGLVGFRSWLTAMGGLAESFGLGAEVFLYAFPVATGAMVIRLVLRIEVALLFAIMTSVVLGLMGETDSVFYVYAMQGGVLGVLTIRNINSRNGVLWAGAWVGLGQGSLLLALLLFQATSGWMTYLSCFFAALVSGLISACVVLALTPLLETLFRYTTDLKLLELANLNHPVLKDLVVKAPGSYHHSIIVGSLAEAAAQAIGANPLVARVMAYYHDLGKGCNPGYFIENQRGSGNPHDKLKPSMSAMIIRRHVTDGFDIARKHKLGEVIEAGIMEHHGTTLIQYFFHKAKEHEDKDNVVHDNDYRYPGPKPQSREAALVMLADSIEAAARSLKEPTSARLQGLVNKIINAKFTDGQLDESDLTLRDLHVVAKSFHGVIAPIYHQRVEYPDGVTDISSSLSHDHSHTKSSESTTPTDSENQEHRPDNIKRLGMS